MVVLQSTAGSDYDSTLTKVQAVEMPEWLIEFKKKKEEEERKSMEGAINLTFL